MKGFVLIVIFFGGVQNIFAGSTFLLKKYINGPIYYVFLFLHLRFHLKSISNMCIVLYSKNSLSPLLY